MNQYLVIRGGFGEPTYFDRFIQAMSWDQAQSELITINMNRRQGGKNSTGRLVGRTFEPTVKM